MTLRFAKMQGLGNDFVLLDGVSAALPDFSRAAVQALANRRTGIGFDQLLLLQPATDGQSDFFYRIYNADGGEVGQCGNGARCAHAFLLRHGLTDKQQLRLQTCTTCMVTEMVAENQVRAWLQPPQFFPARREMGYDFFHLDIGNPHFVCLDEIPDDETIVRIGAELNHTIKGGVNVGFGVLENDVLQLVVYERGAGLTAACGSGALAAAIVALTERKTAAQSLQVRMRGGDLLCGMNADGAPWLEGNMVHVFDGEMPGLPQ